MTGAFAYVIYAAIFVAIVLVFEGAYLFFRSVSPQSREINRRLALITAKKDPKAALAVMKQRAGGPLSHMIVENWPGLGQLLWVSRAGVTPAALIGFALGASTLLMLLFTLAHAPILLSILAGIALGAGLPFAVVAFMANARRAAFLEQFPSAVDLVARSLQAGHPIPVALGIVAQQAPDPIGSEFGITIDEMAFGLDRDEALSNMAKRFPLAELQLFVAAIQVTRESGGNLAEVFLKLADVIRGKATLRKKVMALTAEGRMSCIVLAALPLGLFTILSLIRPEFYGAVAGDPLFAPMMSLPPVLLILGVAWIWRMVNFKV
ncbi:MAG: type II secretion system F family protein [Hyphomonadaceae bacterium]|nr:type II secretion system F family protein [Hyphomonadaceae bacterium]